MITISRPKTATKQEFVAALRSGTYNQLQDGRLMDREGNVCAMGVWHILNGDGGLTSVTGSDGVFGMNTKVYNKIASLNDSGFTFAELADLIESFVTDDLSSYGS